MKPNINTQFIGADVFTLSITLAVFVMITFFLLMFIILLFASSKFRSAFFGNGKSKRKSAKKDKAPAPSEPAPSEPAAIDPVVQSAPASEMPTEPKQKQSPRRKRSDDPVQTVPIDFPFTPAIKQGRRNEPTYANTFEREPAAKKARSTTNTYDHIPTVFIPRTTTRPTGTPVTPAKRTAPKKTATAAATENVEADIPATVKTVPLVSTSASKKMTKPATEKSAKSSGAAPKTKK